MTILQENSLDFIAEGILTEVGFVLDDHYFQVAPWFVVVYQNKIIKYGIYFIFKIFLRIFQCYRHTYL